MFIGRKNDEDVRPSELLVLDAIDVLLSDSYTQPIAMRIFKLAGMGLEMNDGLEKCFIKCASEWVRMMKEHKASKVKEEEGKSQSSTASSESNEVRTIILSFYKDRLPHLPSVLGEQAMLFASSILLYSGCNNQSSRSKIYDSIIRQLSRATSPPQVRLLNEILENQLVEIGKDSQNVEGSVRMLRNRFEGTSKGEVAAPPTNVALQVESASPPSNLTFPTTSNSIGKSIPTIGAKSPEETKSESTPSITSASSTSSAAVREVFRRIRANSSEFTSTSSSIEKTTPTIKAETPEVIVKSEASPSIAPPSSTLDRSIQADFVNQPAVSTIGIDPELSVPFNAIPLEVREEEVSIRKSSSSVKPAPPPPPLSTSTSSQQSIRSSPLLPSSSTSSTNVKEDSHSIVKREDVNLKRHPTSLDSSTHVQNSSQDTSDSSSDQSFSLSSDISTSLVSIQCSPITPEPTIIDSLGNSFGQTSSTVKKEFDELRQREKLELFGIAKLSQLVSIAGAVAIVGKELEMPWEFIDEGERKEVEEKAESVQLPDMDISSSTSFDVEKQELSLASSYLENIRIFHPKNYSSATAIIAITFAIMAEIQFSSSSSQDILFTTDVRSIIFKHFLVALNSPSRPVNQKSSHLFKALVDVGGWILGLRKTRRRKCELGKMRSKRSEEVPFNDISNKSTVEELVQVNRKREKDLQVESNPEMNSFYSPTSPIIHSSSSLSNGSTVEEQDCNEKKEFKPNTRSDLALGIDSSSSSQSSTSIFESTSHSLLSDSQAQLDLSEPIHSQIQSHETVRDSNLESEMEPNSSTSSIDCHDTASDCPQILNVCQSNQSSSILGSGISKENVHILSSSSASTSDLKISKSISTPKTKTSITNPLLASRCPNAIEIGGLRSQ